jgi:hypothetical protein
MLRGQFLLQIGVRARGAYRVGEERLVLGRALSGPNAARRPLLPTYILDLALPVGVFGPVYLACLTS